MKYILTLVFSISLLAYQSDQNNTAEFRASDLDLPNTDLYEPL